MAKISAADLVKAGTAFLGNANAAARNEQLRRDEKERWEREFQLRMQADRRAQEQLESYKQLNDLRYAVLEAEHAWKAEDRKTYQDHVSKAKELLGGMDPRMVAVYYGAIRDKASAMRETEGVETERLRQEGQRLSNQQQRTLMEEHDLARQWIQDITGMSPEEVQAYETKWGFEESQRKAERLEREDYNKREAELYSRLKSGAEAGMGFMGMGPGREALRAMNEVGTLQESSRARRSGKEAEEKYTEEYGETPSFTALEQAFGKGEYANTGGTGRNVAKEIDSMMGVLKDNFYEEDEITKEGTWNNAAAQALHEKLGAVAVATTEAQLNQMMGSPEQPKQETTPNISPKMADKLRAAGIRRQQAGDNESEGSKKYSDAVAQGLHKAPDVTGGIAEQLGTWVGGHHPGFWDAGEQMVNRTQRPFQILWNETPFGGVLTPEGRAFWGQFTPWGLMDRAGRQIQEQLPPPDWYGAR